MAATDYLHITPEEISAAFYEVDGILYNKVKRWSALVGMESGNLSPDGYRVVCFKKRKSLKAHRIIWCLRNGRWPLPGMEIDHRDGNRSNNRDGNLREVPGRGNCQNSALRSDSTSGHTGVNWAAYTNRWRARISHKGKTYCLGYFDSKDAAISARLDAKRRLHEFQPIPRDAIQ
jgi:hypothetical protein